MRYDGPRYDQDFYDYHDAKAAHHMAQIEMADDLSYEDMRRRIDEEEADDG